MDSTVLTGNPAVRPLPSGRSVVVRIADGREELEVRSPAGAVEVHIVLTDAGPVVRLSGARLELDAADSVAVRCRHFEVQASESAALHSGGTVEVTGPEMRVRTSGDIHLDGDTIRLNCADGPEARGRVIRQ